MKIPAYLFVVLTLSSPALAAGEAWSFTMEEMRARADAFIVVASDRIPRDHDQMLAVAIKAAEFRGYVAAALDLSKEQTADCARRIPVGHVATGAASLIQGLPLDRSGNAAFAVLMAIKITCESKTPAK